MKPVPNLSFSCEENRVDYHYIPEHYFTPVMEGLNICQIYERSLSSSYLPMPNLPLSINSSISFDFEIPKQLRSRSQSQVQAHPPPIEVASNTRDFIKLMNFSENKTKVEFEGPAFVQLGLDFLVPNKKMSTKNVLRNFGNAQNQYILHNTTVQNELKQTIKNKEEFEAWIRKLKLLNFSDYKVAWKGQEKDSPKLKKFKKLYRNYCWNFYEQECIPYIFNSRLTHENKKSHLLQIYKMLSGIVNPENFEGFKQ